MLLPQLEFVVGPGRVNLRLNDSVCGGRTGDQIGHSDHVSYSWLVGCFVDKADQAQVANLDV
ncbi:MAG: hypothetical protein J6N20_02540, partial [Pseudomonas sp.]|nr:hypothetical protein [Pseudomonas sp.]